MTLQETILKINDEKINAYSFEQKAKWINTVNRQAHEVLKLESAYTDLEYPKDQDTELLIVKPYDEVYEYYCYAKIDLLNNEIANYNNSSTLYNNAWEEYKKAMIRQGHLSQPIKFSQYEP